AELPLGRSLPIALAVFVLLFVAVVVSGVAAVDGERHAPRQTAGTQYERQPLRDGRGHVTGGHDRLQGDAERRQPEQQIGLSGFHRRFWCLSLLAEHSI